MKNKNNKTNQLKSIKASDFKSQKHQELFDAVRSTVGGARKNGNKQSKIHYYVSGDNLDNFLHHMKNKALTDKKIWFADMVIQNNRVIKSRFAAPTKRLSDLNISLITKNYQGVVISV